MGKKKQVERALAHIEKIEWIKPIEGADNIVLIGVLGWICIAKKNEFEVGDKCVYIEIDSLCPSNDERFEFLAKKKYKVKTMKLNKFNVFSQGLALPLGEFPEIADKKIGDDVTKELKITYYSEDDRNRKSNKSKQEAKYNSMFSRMKSKHPKFFKSKLNRYLMKRKWGKKLLFVFFGSRKDKPLSMPSFIIKTDEVRCLHCRTMIETDKGRLSISDIVNKKMDVKVLSYNEKTNKTEYKPIVNYEKYKSKDGWTKLTFPIHKYKNRCNTIMCTPDHRFYTKNGYVEAKDLSVGDEIYTYEYAYTDKDINDILGMLLGDSTVCVDKRHCCDNKQSGDIRIYLIQGEKQLDYLKEKVRLLGGDISKIKKSKSGYCDNNVYTYNVNLDNNLIHTLFELGCMKDNKFHVTKEYCDRLSLASLTYWYLDDGCIRNNCDKNKFQPAIQISTNSESKEEVILLINMLQERFGVECNLRKDKGKYYSIYITVEGTRKFLELITPYIPLSMRYKTLDRLKDVEYIYSNKVFNKSNKLLETYIKDIEIIPPCKSPFSNGSAYYDLEIKDNHNFFADRILTHNCENIPQILDSDEEWVVTSKLDGTSATYYITRKSIKSKRYEFGVCSRNIRQKSPDQADYHMQKNGAETNSYWDIALKYKIEDILKDYAFRNDFRTVVLQGEIIGEAIQKNPYKIKGKDFYAFNLYIEGERISTEELEMFCNEYHLNCVPIIDYRHRLPKTMEEMKLEADGFSELNKNVKREGLVYRSLDGQRSFKNVSREYLLKHS